MPNTHDANGRPGAKLSELKTDDLVELDSSFTCRAAGKARLYTGNGGLAFECSYGWHHLSGQADDGEHYVGVYKVGQS